MSPLLHRQAAQMRSFLQREGIRDLYHFTDIENLPLVAQLGALVSKESLENAGLLDQVKTGGNRLSKELDLRFGNWNKVSLSWCPKLPMAYWREQQQHLCYVVVNHNIALRRGVVFTDKNAASPYTRRYEGLAGLQLVDFDCVRDPYAYTVTERKERKQAEILVPDQVLLEDILSIGFRSESSLSEARRICREYRNITNLFRVDASLYNVTSRYICAYTVRHWLIAQQDFVANPSDRNFSHQEVFPEGTNLLLITEIQSIYGTRERLAWQNGSNITDRILTSVGPTLSLHPIDCNSLDKGSYTIEYYLTARQEIRQFQTGFRLV
jgi:hypothetical protein